MLQEQQEYGTCLSELDEQDGHLADKLNDLGQINPRMFWSQKTLDEALRICCVICEKSDGSLGCVWRAGLAEHWNLWMQRFRDSGLDVAQQLRDRESTITVPRQSVQMGFLVLHDGVTWTVSCSEPDRFVISRFEMTRIVNRTAGRGVQVVLRGR